MNNASIGQRFILGHDTLSTTDIAKILMENFPGRIATAAAPAMMIRMAAQFDPALETILPHLVASQKVSSTHMQSLPEMHFRSTEAAILETVHSLLREDV